MSRSGVQIPLGPQSVEMIYTPNTREYYGLKGTYLSIIILNILMSYFIFYFQANP